MGIRDLEIFLGIEPIGYQKRGGEIIDDSGSSDPLVQRERTEERRIVRLLDVIRLKAEEDGKGRLSSLQIPEEIIDQFSPELITFFHGDQELNTSYDRPAEGIATLRVESPARMVLFRVNKRTPRVLHSGFRREGEGWERERDLSLPDNGLPDLTTIVKLHKEVLVDGGSTS